MMAGYAYRLLGFVACLVLLSATAAHAKPAAGYERVVTTADGPVGLHIVHHASFVLRWQGKTIYVDPTEGGRAYAGLAPPDIVLLTHRHGDHLSPDTLAGLDLSAATLVMPATVAAALPADIQGRRRVLMANGDTVLLDGLSIHAVPMYNMPPSPPEAKHAKGDGNGYVLTMANKRIYISGDTEGTPEMRALPDIDVAFVCMNLPYTMGVAQAADAVADLAPRVVYPYHYRGQDTADFARRLHRVKPAINVRLRDWYPADSDG